LGRRPSQNAHRYGWRDLSALRPILGKAERSRAGWHQPSASRPCFRPAGAPLAEPSAAQGTAAHRGAVRQ
jgi:hypothetical protein